MELDIQSIILAQGAKFNAGLFILMLVMIVLSAFFSMSETAFSSTSQVKLKVEVENRKKGAKKALQLSENFEKVLTTLLIGNNLVNTALSTVSVTFFTLLAIDANWISLINTVVVTIVLLIFGEIVPKMIAKQHPEAICVKVAWIIYIISIIFYPLVILFSSLQRLINRNKDDKNVLDENELGVLLNTMEEEGEIENDEASMIRNVFDLNDRTVEDIMIPRIQMEAIDYDSTLDEVKDFMLNHSFSRIPVYKKDKDHVIGILYERDFFPAIVKNPKCSWKRLIRPVKFVASSMKVDALIEDLQKTTSLDAPMHSLSLVNSAASITFCPIILTASRLIPARVDPIFTDEQTKSVSLRARGIESINSLSPGANPFWTNAVYPPIKLTPISLATLSKVFAYNTGSPPLTPTSIEIGVTETLLLTIGIPYFLEIVSPVLTKSLA